MLQIGVTHDLFAGRLIAVKTAKLAKRLKARLVRASLYLQDCDSIARKISQDAPP